MKRVLYVLVGCLWLVMGVGVISAQDSRAVSEQNLGVARNSALRSTVPSGQSHLDIRTGNTQTDANDPLHPCYQNDISGSVVDNAGTYSVFTRVTHPGGTLSINTSGSNYDTVLSVFTYVDPELPLGAALACSDDQTPGSVVTSSVSLSLPAGRYLVMISRFSLTSAGSALNLFLNMNYTPDGVVPANDDPANAIPLTTHKAVTQSGVHFATDSVLEVSMNANCPIYNSVWYSYMPTASGVYQFTSFGSVLQVQPGASYTYLTAVGLYSSNGSGDYFLAECSSSDGFETVTDPYYSLIAGNTYYVRIGSYSNVNLLPGSQYKLRPVGVEVILSTNEQFNNGLTGWKTTKFGVGDGLIDGDMLINAGAEKKTLSQTKTTFPGAVKWVKGGMLNLSALYDYTGTPSGKFTVQVAYSDGRPNTVANAPFSTDNGGYVDFYVPLASTKVKSVKMMATVNPGSGASVTIGYMTLTYMRDPSGARAVDAPVLAFPTVK